MLVGAFDPSAWAGLVFSARPGSGFALKFAIERDGERAAGYDLMHIVHEVGPHAPDGSYARISFDTYLPLGKGRDTPTVARTGRLAGLTLEWARISESTLVGRMIVAYDGVIEACGYFPWDWTGSWTWQQTRSGGPGRVAATSYSLTGVPADGASTLAVLLQATTPERDSDRAEPVIDVDGNAIVPIGVSDGDRVYFRAVLQPRECDSDRLDLVQSAIDEQLEGAAAAYAFGRVRTRGHWDGLVSSITNSLHWMQSIKPESGRRYTPAGRRWIFPRPGGGNDHWTTFCWDCLFNALELDVESPELARETLLAVLETQYENGNIPNWRGRFAGTRDRSQPPVGSFAVLKHYLRTGDSDLLEKALPYLERWSAWWRAPKGNGARRDGDGNGLFEWGCDVELLGQSPAHWENDANHHQLAAWESGQDDLPNWDVANWVESTETFDIDCVDLNSLIALDYECLARIARIVGRADMAARYQTLYHDLVDRINDRLWHEEQGMYVDRSWDGRPSPRLAASNFYPLIAGVPTEDRVDRMLTVLLDERKFWGQYVLPTISRDDAAFSDQQYWRGTIWPPPNYLVYQGLRRYGLDEVAGELAARSVDLFLRNWRDYQLCRENYDSITGEGGGHAFQSWGPLFALIGVEEFIDVTPWEGLRIGTLAPPPDTVLENIRVRNREWAISLGQHGISVAAGGNTVLHSRGVLVLRHLEVGPSWLSAETLSLEPVSLAVVFGSDHVNVTLDDVISVEPASAIAIPAGRHRIRIEAYGDRSLAS
jgi:hypothetical protein